ncbi:MAG: sulfotransferase [Proteobacteria bacterium]|nr:sulfotransferase [Pseudomonadota bacterium]
MKLPVPFIQLPLQFDAERLAREVLVFGPEHWREHPQKYPGNLWLPLLSAGGDPAKETIAGPMRPTSYLRECPYLMQVLSRLGAVWGRSRLMKLTAQAEVTPHFDVHYYWRSRMRVHVPVVTSPSVRFHCGDEDVHMAAGECWIFDTWQRHRVTNPNDVERIHLVADTVGSDDFGELMRDGRMSGGMPEPPGWHTQFVAPTDVRDPPLRMESENVPIVMTPWELREHITFLLGESQPHPVLEPVKAVTARFLGAWSALWSEFGARQEGWPAYRRALTTYEQWLRANAMDVLLVNESRLVNALAIMVLSMALSDKQLADGDELRQTTVALPNAPAIPGPRATMGEAAFDRPVFIMSPPRSGSTLLFETLAQARDVYTIGGESHAAIEGVRELNVIAHNYDSNRLDASLATPELAQKLRQRFASELRDRDGVRARGQVVRMLEKTPKNSLRVPFLAKVFPQAQFVFLYRDVRETLSSMIEAWRSGKFVTYRELPGWTGELPWSLLLTPGWRELSGKPLSEIVASQWETATRILLDDLAAIAPERITVARYDDLLADPMHEIAHLCKALDFAWDRPLEKLPLSRYTVTPPDPNKWKRHEAEILGVLPRIQATVERARAFAARQA